MPKQLYTQRGRPSGPSRLSATEQKKLGRQRRQRRVYYNADYSESHYAAVRRGRRQQAKLLALVITTSLVVGLVGLVYLAIKYLSF